MARRSQHAHSFSDVPRVSRPRSMFKRHSHVKTTFDAGWLVPFFVDEALPGDTFHVRLSAFGRLATPIDPFMDNLYATTFFFAVPNRLLWTNWERFNGAQDNPADTTDYLMPEIEAPAGGYGELSLEDYFGLPTKIAGFKHRADWHRAYNLIYNQWFRDENLQDSVPVPLGDGPDNPADFKLLRRGKRHDYFTASLPWPQKGPAVPLPLTGDAPVKGIGAPTNASWSSRTINTTGGNQVTAISSDGAYPPHLVQDPANPGYPNIVADLSAVTGITINEMRNAISIQQLYERDARGGTRYTEILKSHFGVTSPDFRLQRSEYLGGSTSMINVNPLPQTSESGTTPQGNLAATGTMNLQGHGFSKSFTEHCVLIGLICVRADLTYQQGLDRMWSRRTRWDFFWPELANLGEQAVLSKEIYTDGTASDENVWGYQGRWDEYRYKTSKITGRFRSNSAVPLHSWHLAQQFSTRPVLDAAFIEENPPVDRVIAVQDEPHIIMDGWVEFRAARPMPVFGTPGLTRF